MNGYFKLDETSSRTIESHCHGNLWWGKHASMVWCLVVVLVPGETKSVADCKFRLVNDTVGGVGCTAVQS